MAEQSGENYIDAADYEREELSELTNELTNNIMGNINTEEDTHLGTGTADDPYRIKNADMLIELANQVNSGKTYENEFIKLVSDIDFTGKEIVTIGKTSTYVFKGTFDGDNHKITGISINKTTPSGELVTLFGFVESATIKNLIIENAEINITRDMASAIVGKATTSTIQNCKVSGTVSLSDSTNYCAGIVGYSTDCTIQKCVNEAQISFNSVNGSTSGTVSAGGIVGYSNNTNIEECINKGMVIHKATGPSSMSVGGITGGAKNGSIKRCCNFGCVKGRGQSSNMIYQGGIVGSANAIQISDCYNNGEMQLVDSTNIYCNIGGILGWLGSKSTLSNCYNAKEISVDANIKAGIVASFSSIDLISNCYYLSSTSYYGVGEATEDTLNITTAKSIDLLKGITTQLNSISNVWIDDTNNINGGFPALKWQYNQ